MKPIIDGKGIIAKLGGKELTKEELRRLPKGVKDKVRFYSEDGVEQKYDEEEQLDSDLTNALNSGLITAKLNGKPIIGEEYKRLPEEVRKKDVIFGTTPLGKNFPNLTNRERINSIKGGIGWDNKKEFAAEIGVPENRVQDLISEGLVGMDKGNYVIDNRKGDVMDKIDKFMGKNVINTEWATKEELSRMLDVPMEQLDPLLNMQIAGGFLEEKDGMFRINDSDGKGMQRIKDYLDKLNKSMKKRMTFPNALDTMVRGGIYDAIKKGWIEFMDGVSYTADEWKNLNETEQELVGVRLTEKGRREIDDDNPLKIYDEIAKKKRADGGLDLVKKVTEKDGMITMELTEEGEKVKKMGMAMGVSPQKVFKTMLNVGLDREMSKFILIDKEKELDGNKRVK